MLGTRATGFFCGAVGGGSELLRRLVHEPRGVLLVLTALLALLAFALSRVTWRPTAPLHLARRRAWGQIIAAAGRMYRRRMSLFVGIGLLFVPIALLIALLQTVVTRASSVAGISTEGEGEGCSSSWSSPSGPRLLCSRSASSRWRRRGRSWRSMPDGRSGPLRAYRLALGSLRSLFVALMIAVLAVLFLAGSVVLIPIAIWLAVRWALIAPAIELEGLSGFEALRRSGHLVRRKWLKVGSLTILGAAIALVTGSLAGASDPRDGRAACRNRRRRRNRLRGDAAIRRPDDGVRVLRYESARRARRAGGRSAVCGDRARGRSRYTPVCASRRPDLTASTKASKSRSFWSA